MPDLNNHNGPKPAKPEAVNSSATGKQLLPTGPIRSVTEAENNSRRRKKPVLNRPELEEQEPELEGANNSQQPPISVEANEEVVHRAAHRKPNAARRHNSPLAVLSGTAPVPKRAPVLAPAQAQAQAEEEEVQESVAQPVSKLTKKHDEELKASEMTDYNELEGKKISEQEINIGGEIFSIKYDKAARSRRKNFFKKVQGALLTKEEERLLTYLSIVGDTRDVVSGSLYDFFEALPDCQSSAAILSNRKCEVSYYVIWSVLLKARQDVQRKIDETSRTTLNEEKLLQYEARLKSMKSRSVGPIDGKTPCDQNKEQHAEIIKMIKDLQKEIRLTTAQKQRGGMQQTGGALSFLQQIYASITD